MELKIYQVDAFTDEVFTGNPAAIVPLDEWLPDETMQKIAMENSLSETAFFVPQNDKYHIRWFTPSTEVKLCGHATLASAYVILTLQNNKADHVIFTSLSGDLTVTKNNDGFTMNFPVWEYEDTEVTDEVTQALGAKPSALFKGSKWIALFDSEETVRNLKPDLEKIKNIKDANGILPTAKGKDVDFVSRNFAPQLGIPEDPVTGSAHCLLTPFWAKRLNKNTLLAYQASERGGYLKCELKGDRVNITGKACLYMKGTIHI